MTTTFPLDNRTIINESDLETDWTGTITVAPFTAAPAPIEASSCLGMVVSNTVEDAYDPITSDDWSNGTLSIWMRPYGAMDTKVNGGVGIQVGDGTNRIAYHVGGSDAAGFKHENGPHEWGCFLLDLGNKPANHTVLAGVEANLSEAAITEVGVYFGTIVKSVGGGVNCYWDILRWANPGDDVVMQGGATSGAAGNGEEAAVVDRSTGNQQAYGVIRELTSGVYGIQGNLTIGNSASATDQYWEETNVTYAWEDRGLSALNYYRFAIIGRVTQTSSVIFNASTFSVPAAASASFDGNGADLDVCTMNACTFIGFDQGIETSDDAGDNWTNCAYIANDQIIANGCDMTGSSISSYEGIADTSSLVYNLAVNPSGTLDDMTFTKGTALTHAIEFGLTSPLTMTITGINFSGYNAANAQSDSALHIKRTTGTVNITVSGGSGTVSYKTDGATVNILNDVTVTFTGMRDDTEVRVYKTSDNSVVAGIEDAITGGVDNRSFAWSAAAALDVYYVIHHWSGVAPFYQTIRVEGYIVPSTNTSIAINQLVNRNAS